MPDAYPDWFLKKLNAIQAKRAKTVIQHILANGAITTEELKAQYGYNHPPRAIRDVREQGIALEKFAVKDSTGRTIAAYRFADPALSQGRVLAGRKLLSKALKDAIILRDGSKCAACCTAYEPRYLQIDHRIPYEVQGDSPNATAAEYMLLCGSCNRAKSWSCEQCKNWREIRDPAICLTCYWANPVQYQHIAMEPIRRADIVWSGDETADYDILMRLSKAGGKAVPDYVKDALKNHVRNTPRPP